MSFLQPFILWGLPLVLLPVIIHLLNRMRYRTVVWAAMMFLLTASKQATRQARIREWLILACRILAVLALILFVARPLVGGWLGSAAGSRLDTVIVLLDRSPSMEAVDPQTRISKRALALRRLAEASAEAGRNTRYVLIDSATRKPQEFSSPDVLKDLSVAGPSDSSADIPALFESALEYLRINQAGRSEIWLCTDLQQSNWQPDAPSWGTVRERFKQLGQETRVRLLALTQPTKDNIGVRVTEVVRKRTRKGYELQITAELTGQNAASGVFPLTIVHEGARSQQEVTFGGQKLTTTCRLDLGPRQTAGWGYIELPADSNPRDNQAFFVYPEDLRAKSVVVAESPAAGRLLRLAAAPAPLLLNQIAETQTASDPLKLDDVALLVWQAPPPAGPAEKTIQDFVSNGGVVLYLPATVAEDGKFRVATWRNTDGPLSKTQDGKDLPLPEVNFAKRIALSTEGSTLALFDDGKPFLTKIPAGRGAIYHCASLPVREWSSLDDGAVLVPMVQRMVQEGARRLGSVEATDVGDPRYLRTKNLFAAETRGTASPEVNAGIYQQDTRLAGLNRPAREDDPDRMDEDGVKASMGTIPYRLFEEKGTGATATQTEIWRWVVIGMLLFLTGEAIFSLPAAAPDKRSTMAGNRVMTSKEQPTVAGGRS